MGSAAWGLWLGDLYWLGELRDRAFSGSVSTFFLDPWAASAAEAGFGGDRARGGEGGRAVVLGAVVVREHRPGLSQPRSFH